MEKTEQRIIRVFPRRTRVTPRDDYAFVGNPSMFSPAADSVCFGGCKEMKANKG